MAPNGKKHLPLDVLSNLPKIVVDDILMRLPLRDAVRTGILSKKWRFIWCSLPELKLDATVWMKKDLTYDTSNPAKIIYHILTHHAGPITNFNLSFPFGRDRPNIDCADIYNLIYFLSRHDIEHLILNLVGADVYQLPSSLFTYSQLRHLSLQNCKLLPPPTFKGFERLTSLELDEVRISSRVLESLITNASMLEKLVRTIDVVCGPIEINAPMLRTFNFMGNLRFLRFKNVPLLSELSIFDTESCDGMDSEGPDIVKLFQPLSALERLTLWCFPVSLDLAPTRLPFNLNRVKHFTRGTCFCRLEDVLPTLCLIRSLPHLEFLKLQVAGEEAHPPALECLEMECFSDVTFDHLKEVEMLGIYGSDPEFQLIKVLLAKSPVLEKMIIKLDVNEAVEPEPARIGQSVTVHTLAKITNFQRASAAAEVIFGDV